MGYPLGRLAVSPEPLAVVRESAGPGESLLAVDADLVWLHDPETPGDCLTGEQRNRTRDYPQNSGLVLSRQSEHHEPGIEVRGIGPDVREIKVQRDQHASFALADRADGRVNGSAKTLLAGGHRIVSGGSEQLCRFGR